MNCGRSNSRLTLQGSSFQGLLMAGNPVISILIAIANDLHVQAALDSIKKVTYERG